MNIGDIKKIIIDILDCIMALAGVILIPIFLLGLTMAFYSMTKYYSTCADEKHYKTYEKIK